MTPNPSRPLFATKHGWPSVIADSIVWKSAVTRSAAVRSGLESLYAELASVLLISSRYTGNISVPMPSILWNSVMKSSASTGRSPSRWMLSASTSQWFNGYSFAVKV